MVLDIGLVNNGLYSALHGLRIRTDTVRKQETSHKSLRLMRLGSLNQMIKYYKYGFGRVTDYVNEAIRFGDISRDEEFGSSKSMMARSDKYIATFADTLILVWTSFGSK